MASYGMDITTGRWRRDWPHIEQSIQVLLTTMLRSRLMLREYGSELPLLVDRNMNDEAVLQLYVAVATALETWEPRFRLTDVSVDSVSADGSVQIQMRGEELPRGHFGDETVAVQRSISLTL